MGTQIGSDSGTKKKLHDKQPGPCPPSVCFPRVAVPCLTLPAISFPHPRPKSDSQRGGRGEICEIAAIWHLGKGVYSASRRHHYRDQTNHRALWWTLGKLLQSLPQRLCPAATGPWRPNVSLQSGECDRVPWTPSRVHSADRRGPAQVPPLLHGMVGVPGASWEASSRREADRRYPSPAIIGFTQPQAFQSPTVT